MAAKMKQKATKKNERAVGEEGPSSTMDIIIPTNTAIISRAYSTLSNWAACMQGWFTLHVTYITKGCQVGDIGGHCSDVM